MNGSPEKRHAGSPSQLTCIYWLVKVPARTIIDRLGQIFIWQTRNQVLPNLGQSSTYLLCTRWNSALSCSALISINPQYQNAALTTFRTAHLQYFPLNLPLFFLPFFSPCPGRFLLLFSISLPVGTEMTPLFTEIDFRQVSPFRNPPWILRSLGCTLPCSHSHASRGWTTARYRYVGR